MNIDFAFVCDYAEAARKINALGIGFDTIYANQVPYRFPSFFFVIQIRATVVEVGEKKFEVHLIDDDGKEMMPVLRAGITIPKPVTGTESISRIALQIQNVEFPQYGIYSLRTVLDGHEMSNINLRVSQPP